MTAKELEAKVKEANTPEESANLLINGLADALDALDHDPVAIRVLAKDLRDSASTLSSAITATATTKTSVPPQHPRAGKK